MPAPRRLNSNLFSINFESTRKILKDANEKLIDQRNKLLDTFSRTLEDLISYESVNETKSLGQELRIGIEEIWKSRLS